MTAAAKSPIFARKPAPSPVAFAQRAQGRAAAGAGALNTLEGHTHLQVRLTAAEAERFRHAARIRGLTTQAALVEGVNRLLAEWNEAPTWDPGTRGRKAPDSEAG